MPHRWIEVQGKLSAGIHSGSIGFRALEAVTLIATGHVYFQQLNQKVVNETLAPAA